MFYIFQLFFNQLPAQWRRLFLFWLHSFLCVLPACLTNKFSKNVARTTSAFLSFECSYYATVWCSTVCTLAVLKEISFISKHSKSVFCGCDNVRALATQVWHVDDPLLFSICLGKWHNRHSKAHMYAPFTSCHNEYFYFVDFFFFL